MRCSPISRFVLPAALALVCVLSAAIAAQEAAPQVKKKPFQAVPTIDARENYVAYCATCHGVDGKGQGPVAAALKMPVPDLTTIARRAGKFDAVAVERIISGEDKVPPAHGSLEMPIWGPIFRSVGDRGAATLRLRNIVKYLQTMQVPAS